MTDFTTDANSLADLLNNTRTFGNKDSSMGSNVTDYQDNHLA